MPKRSPWAPRELLDLNPWSLLPAIGLSKSMAWLAQVLWLAFAAVFAILRPDEWQSIGVTWLFGAWALFYITQRLGDREAIVGGAAPHVTRDTQFQLRLATDALFVLLLLFASVVIAFGLETVRAFARTV
jgi:hypothetical protein